ncbi:MAG TPA: 50S ribosomal protein L21 [Xanthobacteraceae bacterium]|nr:50S ribosomal protein L21 [Xanthobacteraceae bacterium]
MFAVIKTGGKQYRVAANDLVTVGKVAGSPGDIVTFPVMMLGGDKPSIGAPLVAGATVAAEVVAQRRGATIIAFKKRRRQNSRRKRGHRQEYTVVRVTEILTDGKAPSKTAPKREPKPKAEAKPEEAPKAAKPKASAKKPATKGKSKSKK